MIRSHEKSIRCLHFEAENKILNTRLFQYKLINKIIKKRLL